MSLNPNSRARFNLSKTVVLLLDPTQLGLDVLAQIMTGFGARHIHRCRTLDEAKALVSEDLIDLFIVDAIAQSGEGYEFVRWLRSEAKEPNRHAPVLMTAGHTRRADVGAARDCGAHFIVGKPLAPIVVLERILWIAKAGRAFMLSDGYIGPDRRFGRDDDRPSRPRNRRDDAPAEPDPQPSAPAAERPMEATPS
jgi:DNA-binding response OmpR family regulator